MKASKIKTVKTPKVSTPKISKKDKPSMKKLCGNRY